MFLLVIFALSTVLISQETLVLLSNPSAKLTFTYLLQKTIQAFFWAVLLTQQQVMEDRVFAILVWRNLDKTVSAGQTRLSPSNKKIASVWGVLNGTIFLFLVKSALKTGSLVRTEIATNVHETKLLRRAAILVSAKRTSH